MSTPSLVRSLPAARPQALTQAAAPSHAYAGLLTPEFIARYSHLAAYREHIVLGNEHLQVVFAGVPHDVPTDDWQKTIVAIFRREAEGPWQLMSSLMGLKLKRLNERGMPFYPIAIDMGREREGHGFLTVIYTDKEGGGSKTALTWRLDPNEPVLSLVTGTSSLASQSIRWQLHVQATGQAMAASQRVAAEASDSDEPVPAGGQRLAYASLAGSAQQPDAATLTIVSFEAFQLNAVQGAWVLEEPSGGLFGLSGFTFLFGPNSSAQAENLRLAMQECKERYAAGLPNDYASEDSFHLLERCQKQLAGASAAANKT